MKEVVITREACAEQGNIYVTLKELRALVDRTQDLSPYAGVHVVETGLEGRVRMLRIIQRETVEDEGDVIT